MASLDSQDGLDHVAGGDERVCPGEWARGDLLASLVIPGRKDSWYVGASGVSVVAHR